MAVGLLLWTLSDIDSVLLFKTSLSSFLFVVVVFFVNDQAAHFKLENSDILL